jgi:Ca2+-binding EF-hand superfamily protein
MKKFALGCVAAAAVTTVALAQAPATRAGPQIRAAVAAKVQQHFERVDANRDGAITQAEVQALHAQRGERAAKRADRSGRRDPAQRFARLDANKDGQVTKGEFDALRAARAQAKALAPERVNRAEQMFGRLDADRNGAITRAEFDAGSQLRDQRAAKRADGVQKGRAGIGRFGGHMFTMADANKDGRVTLQEAQGAALHHFDMADANKDGQVTREERREMRQQMRGHSGHLG